MTFQKKSFTDKKQAKVIAVIGLLTLVPLGGCSFSLDRMFNEISSWFKADRPNQVQTANVAPESSRAEPQVTAYCHREGQHLMLSAAMCYQMGGTMVVGALPGKTEPKPKAAPRGDVGENNLSANNPTASNKMKSNQQVAKSTAKHRKYSPASALPEEKIDLNKPVTAAGKKLLPLTQPTSAPARQKIPQLKKPQLDKQSAAPPVLSPATAKADSGGLVSRRTQSEKLLKRAEDLGAPVKAERKSAAPALPKLQMHTQARQKTAGKSVDLTVPPSARAAQQVQKTASVRANTALRPEETISDLAPSVDRPPLARRPGTRLVSKEGAKSSFKLDQDTQENDQFAFSHLPDADNAEPFGKKAILPSISELPENDVISQQPPVKTAQIDPSLQAGTGQPKSGPISLTGGVIAQQTPSESKPVDQVETAPRQRPKLTRKLSRGAGIAAGPQPFMGVDPITGQSMSESPMF